MRHEPIRTTLGAQLVGGLTEGECLALREHVGDQHIMMAAERIQWLGKADEVAWDELRALMDELIERVLAVGAGLAPIDWTRVGADRFACDRYALAVALHDELLQIRG